MGSFVTSSIFSGNLHSGTHITNFIYVTVHNEPCIKSKFARQSFKFIQERSNEVLGLIHSDICDSKFTEFVDFCA